MRLSVSNIAWDVDEDGAVADLLAAAGVTQVDLAPGKYFADPAAVSEADAERVRRWWADRGFGVAGMQSLLFGTTGLNLFSDSGGAMLARLAGVCRTGRLLGARALTFGSPKNRDRSGLDDDTVRRVAVDFFRRLGDAAAGEGVVVCLEANPVRYGCNFMTGTDEAAEMVRAVDHPAIRLQLDVGAIAVNGEDPGATIAAHAGLIGHIHASEPGLVPLGDGGAPHAAAAAALRRTRPELTVTVEMLTPGDEPALQAVGRAVAVARTAYGGAA
ncbi:sugar phosphate isomerase/epimerase family protein [Phenylobacterium sp.]|uniref:sugar phosphate isomerase/epimerase family protein n=1 Tax=Phenylobacterium sp. TaxID=1871053 RepID=UPI00391D828D